MIPGQVIDWLNENEFRAYPLEERGVRIIPGTNISLDSFILDALLINTTPSNTALSAKLSSIAKSNVGATITILNHPAFNCSLDSFPVYIRNEVGSLLVIGEKIKQLPNGTYSFTDVYFEPTVITEFAGPWNGVTSVTINNTVPISLTGAINLEEGHQVGIKLNDTVISLSAGNNYGLPLTCADIPPEDNLCVSIVSYINGAYPFQSPGNLLLTGGENIKIYDDPVNHRIYVGLAFESQDVCKPITLTPN